MTDGWADDASDQPSQLTSAYSSSTFNILITTVTGEVLNISVQPDTDILAIKQYLASTTGVDVESCSLQCNAQLLDDNKVMSDYGISEGSSLIQSITLPGGSFTG